MEPAFIFLSMEIFSSTFYEKGTETFFRPLPLRKCFVETKLGARTHNRMRSHCLVFFMNSFFFLFVLFRFRVVVFRHFYVSRRIRPSLSVLHGFSIKTEVCSKMSRMVSVHTFYTATKEPNYSISCHIQVSKYYIIIYGFQLSPFLIENWERHLKKKRVHLCHCIPTFSRLLCTYMCVFSVLFFHFDRNENKKKFQCTRIVCSLVNESPYKFAPFIIQ